MDKLRLCELEDRAFIQKYRFNTRETVGGDPHDDIVDSPRSEPYMIII